jgi:Fe-S-cluster-containing hydrogenase component 2/CRP-like cAMP-binding protein
VVLSALDENGDLLPVLKRLMGVAGTLWNQPRSVTLEAADDPKHGNAPCRMLLIKRKALAEIFKTPKGRLALEEKLGDFVRTTLPDVLADNRLFRDMVYPDDVQDWGVLLACFRGTPVEGDDKATAVRRRFADLVDRELRDWLVRQTDTALPEADQVRVVSSLNKVLANPALVPAGLTAHDFAQELQAEAQPLLQGRRAAAPLCETFRLNRLLLDVGCRGAVLCRPQPWPLFREDFRTFAEELASKHKNHCNGPLQPEVVEKDSPVPKEGETAALYLILSGMLRVSRQLNGGEVVANNLEGGGYFGERSVLEQTPPAVQPPGETPPPPPPRGRVQARCKSSLLRLEPDVLRELAREDRRFEQFVEKLRREHQRERRRDKLFEAGGLLPPRVPPPALADELVLTRNILLIDMDRCTRCDQCVRGCAEAHDMQPRFHRANPRMRFGKWEVAGACMHCLDAPCLEACPVGAITFLDDKAVQIHRTRCIGCGGCARKCPFGVIDMLERTSLPDAPSLSPTYAPERVATKCDLCLTEDHDPPCVAWCPYEAAFRVSPTEFFRGLKGRGNFPGAETPT